MDCTAIIMTIGIIFAASFFSTVSGFGFALVAMPVLTLVMSVKAAVIFVLLLNLVLRAITMYRVRDGFDKETVILTTLGSVVGMVPGSWALLMLWELTLIPVQFRQWQTIKRLTILRMRLLTCSLETSLMIKKFRTRLDMRNMTL